MFKRPIVCLCAALTWISLFFLNDSMMLATLCVMALGIIMIVANWSFEHLIVYMVFLMMSVIPEITAVYMGLWTYPTGNFFGIPLWIPFFWSNGALFIVEVKEWVDEWLARKR